jgi:hypothetical protein
VLFFYYSGHSDGTALNLGNDRVGFDELKTWLTDTKADVRVAVIDSCKSGALVQSKGGTHAPPFEINLADQLDASGDATLSSSAADELALESREIRGSFFTHHFVSGLRGAADASGDGRITLAEAYRYAFDHTLAATSSTGSRQHPGYNYRLSGRGELVLTEVTQPSAVLELPEGFERALVILVRRDQVLAEITSDTTRKVALAPGEYAVRVWKGTRAYATRVETKAGEVKKVDWSNLSEVPSPAVARKGESDDERDGMSPEARVEYDQKYLTVIDEVELYKGTSFKKYEVHQGKYKNVIAEGDFFRMTGRPDYAESYESRQTTKTLLQIAGVGAIAGGVVYSAAEFIRISNIDCGLNDPAFGQCVQSKKPDVLTPILLTMGGVGVLFGAGFINPHPTTPSDMRRLADEYNAGLRRRLSEPVPASSTSGIRVQAAPYAGRSGGGLVFRATF